MCLALVMDVLEGARSTNAQARFEHTYREEFIGLPSHDQGARGWLTNIRSVV